jgi:hypothetical protein
LSRRIRHQHDRDLEVGHLVVLGARHHLHRCQPKEVLR